MKLGETGEVQRTVLSVGILEIIAKGAAHRTLLRHQSAGALHLQKNNSPIFYPEKSGHGQSAPPCGSILVLRKFFSKKNPPRQAAQQFKFDNFLKNL
jgi:hypothetical protein